MHSLEGGCLCSAWSGGGGGGGGLGAAGLHLHGPTPPLFDIELNRTGGRALLTWKTTTRPRGTLHTPKQLACTHFSTGFFPRGNSLLLLRWTGTRFFPEGRDPSKSSSLLLNYSTNLLDLQADPGLRDVAWPPQ